MTDAAETTSLPSPPFRELLRLFARIGCISFGGPAGQIALMHREIVDERRWVSERDYLGALNLCHLLPGPEAQQLATWIGWRLHGVKGGLAAGGLFVLPGALVMLLLSMLYGFAARLDWFAALFLGIKAAVLAIVAQALLRIAGRALKTPFMKAMALLAFAAIVLANAPFPVIVLGAGLIGALVSAWRPDWLGMSASAAQAPAPAEPLPWRATLGTVLVWAAIWVAPLLLVALALGPDHVLMDIGAFFAKLAVVTFGGAYAVLAYMAQQAVEGFSWLSAGEMADGLGLAETTPGPLIMVTQFVGYLAAYRAPEPFSPVVAGILGAGLTTWVTFAPCFLWIFAVAPWMARLERLAWLKAALATLTAAIVGVIASLALWFAGHVLFARMASREVAGLSLTLPDWISLDWRALLLAALAAALLFGLRWGVLRVLAACAAAGLLLGL